MSDTTRPSPEPGWRDRLEQLRTGLPGSGRMWLPGIAAVVALAGAALFLLRRPSAPPLTLPRASAPAPPMPGPTASSAPVPVVHVAGAVGRPGVVRLAPGARVADAVQAAGGPSPEADLDQLNLAAPVADGDRVYVARRGEAPPPAPGVGPAGAGGSASGGGAGGSSPVLDLNAATPEQLDTLPGVGPATAQAIVAYRQQHGRFKSVDQLLEVRGVGSAKLEQLRPRVRV